MANQSSGKNESTRTVLVAIGADLGVALAKTGAAVLTGSSAVAASAAEALADTTNDLFLLLAQHRSHRAADDHHALGYGREAYFWATIAGLGVLVGGAAFSLREGINQLINPTATSSFTVAYVVLAISAGFDLMSMRQSAGQMTRRARRFDRKLLAEARATSDPMLRTIFVSDAISAAGDLLAIAALALDQITGSSIPQATVAVLIGLALISAGFQLVRRSHDFLVGAWVSTAGADDNRDISNFTQPLLPAWEERARAFLLGYPGMTEIREILVTFVGPGKAWIVARVGIDDGLSGAEVESLVRDIESGAKQLGYIYRIDVVAIGGTRTAGTASACGGDAT